ncbi:N-acyl homoserine lactonase family protein [Mucilaginibacter sp. CSA2-8R]|uniref:N-acyl homoserine lactonase family protein n=1 Tax=Mucilaginibacter sp. CSA2-8R TaxID=3141542 RepID=UPI00315C5D8D
MLYRISLLITVFLFVIHTDVDAQTPAYKIYAVPFAHSGYPFTAADWAQGGSKTEQLDITFSIWLIKSSTGRCILVDAGFERDIEDAKEFQLSSYIRPDSALRQLGVKPEDVTDVIISHPHWDHIDGVNHFPKAQFWMQKEDFDYFVGRAWQQPKDTGGFAKRDVRKLTELNLAGRLKLISGDNQQILPGIKVFTGSKHTYGSQYVLVDKIKQPTIIASDNVWIEANIRQLLPPVKGGTLSPAGYIAAMKRMKTMVKQSKYIIPGHDGVVYKRFPAVGNGIVQIK